MPTRMSLVVVVAALLALLVASCGEPTVPVSDCARADTCGICMGARPGASACGWCVSSAGVQSCQVGRADGAQPPTCDGRWLVNQAVSSCPEIAADPHDPN